MRIPIRTTSPGINVEKSRIKVLKKQRSPFDGLFQQSRRRVTELLVQLERFPVRRRHSVDLLHNALEMTQRSPVGFDQHIQLHKQENINIKTSLVLIAVQIPSERERANKRTS
jgi:hypothetical protein